MRVLVDKVQNHIYLERRRLTFAGLLAFIAGYALYSHINQHVMGMPFPIFTGVLYTFFVVLSAAVTTYLFPTFRRLIDGISLFRLCFALWVVQTQNHEAFSAPIIQATVVVGSAIIFLQICTWIGVLSQKPGAPDMLVNITKFGRAIAGWLDGTTADDISITHPNGAPKLS